MHCCHPSSLSSVPLFPYLPPASLSGRYIKPRIWFYNSVTCLLCQLPEWQVTAQTVFKYVVSVKNFQTCSGIRCQDCNSSWKLALDRFFQIPNNWISVKIHPNYAARSIFSKVIFYATATHFLIMNGEVGSYSLLPHLVLRCRGISQIKFTSSFI